MSDSLGSDRERTRGNRSREARQVSARDCSTQEKAVVLFSWEQSDAVSLHLTLLNLIFVFFKLKNRYFYN